MTKHNTHKVDIQQNLALQESEPYLIVGYNDNLVWLKNELDYFFKEYGAGESLKTIAKKLKRPLCEVCYLVNYLEHSIEREDIQKLYPWSKSRMKAINKLKDKYHRKAL